MVKINGSSFPHQYRRTNPFPIDSTETWDTLEDATAYARNTDTDAYMPYSGQVISIEGKDDLYVLVEDETISKADGRNHFKLHKVSTEEDSSEKYLSKVVEDRAKKLIHFDEGIDVKGGVKTDTVTATEGITGKTFTATDTVKGNNVQAVDTVSGKNATISAKTTTLNLLVQALADTYDLSVSHVATMTGTIVKDYISSESYVSGMSGNGMKIYKALNGDWNMELDNLTVRKIFTVFELVVQKIVHQGGMVIRSAAGGKLTKVTDGGTYWKCEYDSTDDFVKDDQIVCQAFTGTVIKRYWRLVTSAGAGYFNLSKSDCEAGSGTPEVGDDVSVLGNRTNTARQKAQIDCAVGDTAPYRDDYAGINSYSLAGKLITRTGELSGITDAVFGVLSGSGLYATNVYLKGMFILRSGKSVESELNAVNAAVIAAQNAASTAQSTADAAKANATAANDLLSDIANDNKLTPTEKQSTKKEWDIIMSEKVKNDASADMFNVDKAAYGTVYSALNTYITPLLSSLTTTSAITGADFRAKFKAYYDARTDLLNAISAKAKSLADAAQTKADAAGNAASAAQKDATAAKTAAGAAQTTANNAVTSANGANALLSDIASDSKLTPTEKQQTKKEWDVIVSEKPLNNASAVKFGVATTSYDAAYNTLNTYITPLLASLTTTSDIVGTTFRNTFKVYYDARTNLLNAVSAAAKTLADNAQSKADAAQKSTEDLGTRITTVETKFEIREGQISSKVTEATTAATNAKKSETSASGSASTASSSATTAGLKASEASGSATSAAGSATNAGNSASAAAKSATDAKTAASDAGKVLEEVTLKESSIIQTAGKIATNVTEVTKKVTEANTAASNAGSSATAAAGSATNAGNSATAASGSAGTASTKAGEASTSATNASKSATSAAGSATTASTKAGEASTSAGNAKKSADDAAAKLVTITEKESSINQTASGITLQVKEVTTKVSEAATSATNAGNSASTASSKATAAGNSATAAAGSAGTATTKAGEAATSASTATTKANAASGSATAAATSATNAKNSADASAVVLQTVSTKQSEINAKADQITLKVTEVTEKTVQATNAAELATAMSKGRMLYRDPTFESGLNGTGSYALVGTRTIEAITGCPNRLAKGMKITATGWNSATDPRVGGFLFSNQSRANAVFVIRIVALIPTGRTIQNYHNSYGTGGAVKWLTSQAGTGKWEEYVYKITCGSSGTFSTINHFALTGGTAPTASAPVVWYVAYATVFDVTDAEVDYIADAAGKYTTKTTYEAGIKVLSDSITSKVSQSDFNALGNRVSNAETTITQHTGQIALKASQSDVTALGTRMSSAEAKITPDAIKLTVKSQTETIAADTVKDRPTTETIKSQIALDGFGISVFGKKIDFTGKVTFSSMDSATQSTINGKATTGYVDTAKSSAISTAASDAQSKADSAKSSAISTAANDATTKANNAKSAAISAAATDATTKANNALSTSRNDVAVKLGYSSYTDMVNKATASQTIINGGYIRTSLIQANTITADKIATGTITADKLNIGNVQAQILTADAIQALDITTGKLKVTTGATIGGFKVDGINMCNRDNQECWISIDRTVGSTRRISSLGNNIPSTAGIDTAGYFSATGPNENRALVLNASGSNYHEWSGGKTNFAIDAVGGCKWKMKEGDHWSMPGLLGIIRFLCTFSGNSYNYTMQRIWGHGIPLVYVRRFSVPDLLIDVEMEMGTSFYSLTGQSVGPSPIGGIWDSTFVIESLSQHGFIFSCWRNGIKFIPRQVDIFIFGDPV